MVLKKLMVVAAMIVPLLASCAAAQEKGNKADMAKVVAGKFAKDFIQDKNVAEAMKLTSVPFLEVEQGRERSPKKIEKSADVKKRLESVVKRHDEIGIRAKVTIAKVQDASADVQLDKSTKDVFDAKTDRIFVISFVQNGGFPFELLTLVSSREDKSKVIGFGLYFSR